MQSDCIYNGVILNPFWDLKDRSKGFIGVKWDFPIRIVVCCCSATRAIKETLINLMHVYMRDAVFARNLRFTNHQNQGLISVDRKTSLLSHVQYPVPSKSSTEDLTLNMPKRRIIMVFGRSLSLRVNTQSGNIVAFQHRF